MYTFNRRHLFASKDPRNLLGMLFSKMDDMDKCKSSSF